MSKKRKNNWSLGVIPPEKTQQALQFALANPSSIEIPQWVRWAIQEERAKQRVDAMTPDDWAKAMGANAFLSYVIKNGPA